MSAAAPPKYEITVAICTRNRRESLLATLDTLTRPQWDGPWEVLVIDNGSDDDTTEAVARRRSDFPVPLRFEIEPDQGISIARNRALQTATGRVVIFFDDDLSCHPNCVAAHARAFEDPSVAGSGGRILPVFCLETPEWYRQLAYSAIGGPAAHYDFGPEGGEITAQRFCLPFGGHMGVNRETALRLGGFRTDLGWGKHMIAGEETEFFRRMSADGGRIVYVPDASVDHRILANRATFDYVLRWSESLGRARIAIDTPTGFDRARGVLRLTRTLARRYLRLCRYRLQSNEFKTRKLRSRCAIARGELYQLLGI